MKPEIGQIWKSKKINCLYKILRYYPSGYRIGLNGVLDIEMWGWGIKENQEWIEQYPMHSESEINHYAIYLA